MKKTNKEISQLGKIRDFCQSILGKVIFVLLLMLALTVALGTICYRNASRALTESYIANTSSTVKAITDYFTQGVSNARNQVVQLYRDDTINEYHNDTYKDDELAAKNGALLIKSKYASITAINPLCYNIMSISKNSKLVTAERIISADGVYEKCKEIMDASETPPVWIRNHDFTDQLTETDSRDYVGSYMSYLYNADGFILVDISAKEICSYLNSCDIGEEGILSFVASDSKEYYAVNEKKENAIIKGKTIGSGLIAGQKFYKDAVAGQEESGYKYVTFNGEDYLFIYNKVENTGFTVTGLIPKSVVINQAESIRYITLAVASVIALIIIGIGITISISTTKRMRVVGKQFDRLASGDFTVEFASSSKDEFGQIFRRMGGSMAQVRKLIKDMKGMNEKVNDSTLYVTDLANGFARSAEEISDALQEVAKDVVNQANDADNCLNQMNQLSNEVQEVFEGAEKIESISTSTSNVVEEGMSIVDQLAVNMKDSSSMTKVVIENVEDLSMQSKNIKKIVEVINEIAEETNLLSLNASIEAARAGEAGRGFVVVADQVRKLADQSVMQAEEIDKIVHAIQARTEDTVKVARKTEEYIEIQEASLQRTVSMFHHIKEQFQTLVAELKNITDGIERIEKEKNETLTSVKNISCYTQETSAVTEEISATSLSQIESVGKLRECIGNLEKEAGVLNEAVGQLIV